MNLKNRSAIIVALAFVFASAVNAQTQTQPRSDSAATPKIENTSADDVPAKTDTNTSVANDKPAKKNEEVKTTPEPIPPQTTDPDEWHFQFSPYLWIAGINGTAGIRDLEVAVDSGLTDDNVKLNSGFMGAFEARKNRWVLLTDIQYSNLGTDRPNPGILFSSASADFKTFILDPEVGYRVAENVEARRSVDVFGGVRWWHLETNLHFAAGILAAREATASRGWLDAIGGVRGKAFLSKSLFVAGKFDLGGGGSKFTYQLFGIGGWQVHPKVALIGGYRVLHTNYDKDDFLFDMTLSGPVIGATFIFK